jgi:hypothetical protein
LSSIPASHSSPSLSQLQPPHTLPTPPRASMSSPPSHRPSLVRSEPQERPQGATPVSPGRLPLFGPRWTIDQPRLLRSTAHKLSPPHFRQKINSAVNRSSSQFSQKPLSFFKFHPQSTTLNRNSIQAPRFSDSICRLALSPPILHKLLPLLQIANPFHQNPCNSTKKHLRLSKFIF